jgi:hypothetical protein
MRAKVSFASTLGVVLGLVAVSLFWLAPDSVQAQNPPGGPAPGSAGCRDISLLGHPNHVAGAQQLLRELNVGTSTTVPRAENDRVFFVVSAADGPMPATREAIQNLPIQSFQWRAILITDTRRVDDAELLQLVVLEVREVLARSGVPRVESIPIFFDNAEHFRFMVHGFRCIR